MKVIPLPEPHGSVSVEMALQRATEADLDDIFICGYDKNGNFLTFNARMTNADIYYALARAQNWIMNGV